MVKITSKGQLTLPVDIRRKLGIEPGDEVDVEIVDEESARLKITPRPSLSSLYGSLYVEKPLPDKKTVRKEIGKQIGQQMDSKRDRE